MADQDLVLDSLQVRFGPTSPGHLTCASIVEVEDFERAVGLTLPVFYRRLVTEVANGGFGPASGLFGIPPNGYVDDDLGTNLRDAYLEGRACHEPEWRTPCGLLALCNWGCGIFSYIDCFSELGAVVTDELLETRLEYTETSSSLADWLGDWLSGVDLDAAMHRVVGHRDILNPFTKKPISMPVRERIGRHLDFRNRNS